MTIESRSFNAKPGARRLLRALIGLSFFALKAAPARMLAMSALIVISNFTGPASAVGLKWATDAVIAGDMGAAVGAVLLIAALSSASDGIGWASLTVRMGLRERVGRVFDTRLIELAMAIPGIEHYEKPEYQDELQLLRWQRDSLATLPDAVVANAALVLRIGSTIGLLAAIDTRLLLLPLFAVPAVSLVGRGERRRIRVQNETAPPRRLANALFRLGTEAPLAKEIRVFGLAEVMRERQRGLRDHAHRVQVASEARTAAESVFGWLSFAAGFVLAAWVVVGKAIGGEASVGDVVLALSLARQINDQATGAVSLLSWAINCGNVGVRYLWLVDYADRAIARVVARDPKPAPLRMAHGIDFVDVSFRYEGKTDDALRGVSLHIPAGSTLAIVGENGAGKSTLVKLLFRFYEPDSGAILVDGVPLASIDPADWRLQVSAGFQDFCRFELLARESVGVGSLGIGDDDAAVLDALERAGSAELLGDLPSGLDTQLGRMFDGGVELSGGQWQKVALGRSMMREVPLVLALDEPTSALDPYTEHRLFERFAEVGRAAAQEVGAVTILVSHRFSTVRMADHIVVVDDGRIVESGSHDELVARDGLYAELYELQARSYR